MVEGTESSTRHQHNLLVEIDVLEDAVVVGAVDLVDLVADRGGDDTGDALNSTGQAG